MTKKIKESEGFIVNWNKKRKRKDDITFFVRYKDKVDPTPKHPVDLARFLIDKIKEIEKRKRR